MTLRNAVKWLCKEVIAVSKYTTGEVAKLCNVSVRTVQYYDTRGILVPTALSEGGRRLYSEDDLDKMKLICFLRELELPIDSIKNLLGQEHPENVISMLLGEQEKRLRSEIAEKQRRADTIAQVQRSLARLPKISVESIGDIAHIMERKKQLRRLRIRMLALGLVMDAIEVSTLMLWILRGIWWPFALGMAVVVALGVYISVIYFGSTVYICPECHDIFRPKLREALFARHTPCTRKLTCPGCGYQGFCVETYGKESDLC